MRFFVNSEEGLYLAEWEKGYVQLWSEWEQLKFKKFNWITFVLVEFEIERQLGDGFCIELGLLGFRLRINNLFNESPFYKELQKESKKWKNK